MPTTSAPPAVLFAVLAGLVGGLVLLVRGLVAFRARAAVRSVATSRLDALAAGEVRVTGVVEPLAMTLVSPLQSASCVWYHASITEPGDSARIILDQERATEFRIRDERGSVRVIPGAVHWEIDDRLDETGDERLGDVPGLAMNHGATSLSTEPMDRDAAIAELLTVHADSGARAVAAPFGFGAQKILAGMAVAPIGRRRYREARLEPGQQVTVLGSAVPLGDVMADAPMSAADPMVTGDLALDADLVEARDAGALAPDPATAWGNAAIPGFGIGHPVREAAMDPDAAVPTLASPQQAERAHDLFEPARESLVLAGSPGAPLVIYVGSPDVAEHAHDDTFFIGLAGAALSVVCAVVLAVMVRVG